MSIIHNIIPKRPLDISKLEKFVSTINNAKHLKKSDSIYYFWIDGKSTRGFDITIEKESIEVRNTILSNKHDYDLTNIILAEIIHMTEGVIFDEDEPQINKLPIFSNERITEIEIQDCEVFQIRSKEYDYSIFGPIREVNFGKQLHEKFKQLDGEQLRDKMFEIILTVNYQIPDFEYGDIIRVGKTEKDKKDMKLLTNNTDYIIGKYDYILLKTSVEQPIMITNEILNSILPSSWTRVDEYTIVAPILQEDEWEKLLTNAKKLDLFDSFFKI